MQRRGKIMKYSKINDFYLSVKNKILHLYSIPLLRHLGYKKERTLNLFPTSSYYENDTALVSLKSLHRNYLTSSGWLNSKNMNQSVDQNRYIPWVSFPAIYFLDRLKLNDVRLLEFGGGASTIYFAQKCNKVLCIEFSKSWHEVLEKTLVGYKNTRLVYANAINEQSGGYWIELDLLLQAYSHDTSNFDLKELPHIIENFIKFSYQEIKETDLVFIDGGYRNLEIIIAAYASNNSLGIIIDNADFSTTSFGVKKLKELGYIEIPFHGLSPLNAYSSTTSLYSKEPNKILTLLT